MTILYRFCLLFFFTLSVFSQKPKNEKVEIKYLQLPEQPLETNLKTYNLRITNYSSLPIPNQDIIHEKLVLNGYQYLKTEPDFIIDINLESFESKAYVATYKGNGFTAGSQKFIYVLEGEIRAATQITTPVDGAKFYRSDLKNIDDFTSKIDSKQVFDNEADAKKALEKEKKAGLASLSKTMADQFLGFMNTYINDQHGYQEKSDRLPIWTIQSKKHDYTTLQEAKANYVEAMEFMNTENQKASIPLLTKAIDLWKKEILEFVPNDKGARISSKNIGAIYLNLSQAYIWLSKFDEASSYLEKSKESKGQALWKPVIEKLLVQQKKGFDQNKKLVENTLEISKELPPLPITYSEHFAFPENPYCISENLNPHQKGFRLKTIYYYEKRRNVRSGQKKIFTYDDAGITTGIGDEFYNVNSPNQSRPTGQLNYKYENDSLAIDYYPSGLFGGDKLKRRRYIKEGKILSETFYKGSSDADNDKIVMTYDGGKWTGYEKYFKGKKGEIMKISYKENRVFSIIISSNRQVKLPNDAWSHRKYIYNYTAERLLSVNILVDQGENPVFQNIQNTAFYTYNEDGQLVKIKLNGPFYSEYEYDAHGNVAFVAIHRDTQHIRYAFEWEKGNGNEALIRFRADNLSPWATPLLYPIPNTSL